MITKYVIVPMAFVIWSCGSNTSEKKITSDSLATNTISVDVFTTSFPFTISDSSTSDSVVLPASFVRKYVPVKELAEDSWMIEKFLEIDSLKSVGRYNAYVEGLDIGQTKESRAWIYDTLSYPGGRAYVWGLTYQSFEACPYYSGKKIYLTTVSNEGIPKSTIQLTEISSGGDPPSFGSEWGTCIIGEDLKISCKDTSLYGEYGDDGYEDITVAPHLRSYEITSAGTIKSLQKTNAPEIKKRRKSTNE